MTSDPHTPLPPREAARRLRKIAEVQRADLGSIFGPFTDLELEDIAFGLELYARIEHHEALKRAWQSVKDDILKDR